MPASPPPSPALGRDRRWILAAAFLRAVAISMLAVGLAIYLGRLGLGETRIGVVVGAGLAGAAAATLLATVGADRHGRRRFLVAVALVGAAGALAAAATTSAAVLGLAAFVGMLNGMGRDRGAALVVEQAVLPSTVPPAERTAALAWYNVLQDTGHMLGSALAAYPLLLERGLGWTSLASQRSTFVVYAALLAASALCYARLSDAVELAPGAAPIRVSPASRSLLARISALFALDSFAGGFLTTAWLSWFFVERFGASPAFVAALFFAARGLNALSHLGAAWLARRIGLVNTMVFTHVPSSLLLVTVAVAPSLPVAAVLFLLREGLVEMDVPTRQSYVLAVVRPEERTQAAGVTTLVRTAAWAAGPIVAGPLAAGATLATPLVVGAALKITYDLLLYRAFRAVRPPEER